MRERVTPPLPRACAPSAKYLRVPAKSTSGDEEHEQPCAGRASHTGVGRARRDRRAARARPRLRVQRVARAPAPSSGENPSPARDTRSRSAASPPTVAAAPGASAREREGGAHTGRAPTLAPGRQDARLAAQGASTGRHTAPTATSTERQSATRPVLVPWLPSLPVSLLRFSLPSWLQPFSEPIVSSWRR